MYFFQVVLVDELLDNGKTMQVGASIQKRVRNQSGGFFFRNWNLLSQWLTGFKLLGIPYLVGKISRSNFYFRVQDG